VSWQFVGGKDLESAEQLAREFKVSPSALAVDAGVCWSSEPDYSVSMRAIFVKDGKWWEVSAAHCSCNGYDGDWQPSAITRAYVKQLVDAEHKNSWGAIGCADFVAELRKLIAVAEAP
jgi:hypothetical protein